MMGCLSITMDYFSFGSPFFVMKTPVLLSKTKKSSSTSVAIMKGSMAIL